jgi:hypothetical protein
MQITHFFHENMDDEAQENDFSSLVKDYSPITTIEMECQD